MKQHAVIYIPGLGDHSLSGRQKLISTWKYRDVAIELCPMYWTVDEPWETKLSRLLELIETRHAEGKLVSIIGESAGATAVIHATYMQRRKLHSAILLCGKSQFPERVASHLYRKNPAFRDALTSSHKIVQELTDNQKAIMHNFYPLVDPTVPPWETKIPGVKNHVFPAALHAAGIVFAMTAWSWRIVRIIKRKGA